VLAKLACIQARVVFHRPIVEPGEHAERDEVCAAIDLLAQKVDGPLSARSCLNGRDRRAGRDTGQGSIREWFEAESQTQCGWVLSVGV